MLWLRLLLAVGCWLLAIGCWPLQNTEHLTLNTNPYLLITHFSLLFSSQVLSVPGPYHLPSISLSGPFWLSAEARKVRGGHEEKTARNKARFPGEAARAFWENTSRNPFRHAGLGFYQFKVSLGPVFLKHLFTFAGLFIIINMSNLLTHHKDEAA